MVTVFSFAETIRTITQKVELGCCRKQLKPNHLKSSNIVRPTDHNTITGYLHL